MKKIFILLAFFILSLSSIGQSSIVNILEVDNSTTVFGKSLKIGSIVYDKSANTFYEITAVASSSTTLATATKEIAGNASIGVDGSVQFATSGLLNSDGANLFWNDALNALGIRTNTITAGQALDVEGDVRINGKLTVTGLIDPTGIVLDEQSTSPFPATAGKSTIWAKDNAIQTIKFTNDTDVEHDIPIVLSSSPIADGTVMIKEDLTGTFIGSSISEIAGRVIINKQVKFNKGIETTGGSLTIGQNVTLGESASALIIRDRQGRNFTVPQNQISSTGSTPTFVPRVGVETVNVRQGSDVQNQTVSSITWFNIVVDDKQVNKITFRAFSNTTGVRLVIREDNASGDILVITEQDETWELGDGFSLINGGDTPIDLQGTTGSIALFDGDILHFTLEVFAGSLNIRGDTVAFGGQPSAFVPYFTSNDQLFSLNLLADGGGFTRRLIGDVSITPGTDVVTGNVTFFERELFVGESVQIREENFTVKQINSPTEFILSANHIAGAGAGIGGGLNAIVFAEENVLDIKNFDGTSRLKIDRIGNLTHDGNQFRTLASDLFFASEYMFEAPVLSGTTPKTVGRVDVYQETSTKSLVTGTFTPGFPASTNPSVVIQDASTFVANDIVLIRGTGVNDGLYEVSTQVSTLLIIKGIGTTPTTDDFVKDDFFISDGTGTITKVEVSVWRSSLTGAPEHGRGSTTPLTFHVLAHADDVPIVAIEEFANTNARFESELGLPGTQTGWVDSESVNGTITIFADNIFGTPQDAIKYDVPASGDIVKSKLILTGTDWDNILNFGASYSGITRITKDISTQSIFSGMGFSSGNDPRPSSIQSRVGVFISVNATHTTITLDGQSIVLLDGTAGKPLVLMDKWFSWEIFIDKTPDAGVNFGAATMFVNGIQVVVGGIISSNSSVNDEISVANSSSTGSTTFYFANFGVTIYEESSTKTLSTATMAADIAQIFIPAGKRDYTVILPDGNPRKLGNRIDFVVQNIGGKLKIQTQNLSSPQALFNGLREIEKGITSIAPISFINTVEASNIYLEDAETLSQDPLGFAPGSINFEDGTMNIRSEFPGSSTQVGEEIRRRVINNTGATILSGKAIKFTTRDAATGLWNIELSIADNVDNARYNGLTTTDMVDGQTGAITKEGLVNDLDTTTFTTGNRLFISETVAGELTNVKPPVGIGIGFAFEINAVTGSIDLADQDADIDIRGTFNNLTDQDFITEGAGVAVPINLNNNSTVKGLTHSISVDNSEITIISSGNYYFTLEPQLNRSSGSSAEELLIWVEINTGSGFVAVPNSTVRKSAGGSGVTGVSPLTDLPDLAAGDVIRFMAQVTNTALFLDFTAISGTVPATPSVIVNIFRRGN